MTTNTNPILKMGLGAAIGAVLVFSASVAEAGECPAGKVKAGVRSSGETMPKEVTDEELSSIDLGREIAGFDTRRLRFRKLVVEPGGVVPWHDHTNRPARPLEQKAARRYPMRLGACSRRRMDAAPPLSPRQARRPFDFLQKRKL